MNVTDASHKIDRAMTEAIGALRALRGEHDDLANIISELSQARALMKQVAVIAMTGKNDA